MPMWMVFTSILIGILTLVGMISIYRFVREQRFNSLVAFEINSLRALLRARKFNYYMILYTLSDLSLYLHSQVSQKTDRGFAVFRFSDGQAVAAAVSVFDLTEWKHCPNPDLYGFNLRVFVLDHLQHEYLGSDWDRMLLPYGACFRSPYDLGSLVRSLPEESRQKLQSELRLPHETGPAAPLQRTSRYDALLLDNLDEG